jgi:hypothetical protein
MPTCARSSQGRCRTSQDCQGIAGRSPEGSLGGRSRVAGNGLSKGRCPRGRGEGQRSVLQYTETYCGKVRCAPYYYAATPPTSPFRASTLKSCDSCAVQPASPPPHRRLLHSALLATDKTPIPLAQWPSWRTMFLRSQRVSD